MKSECLRKAGSPLHVLRLHLRLSGHFLPSGLLILRKAHITGRARSDDVSAESVVEVPRVILRVSEHAVAVLRLSLAAAAAGTVHAAVETLGVESDVFEVKRTGNRVFNRD